jgi:hypothetical protein
MVEEPGPVLKSPAIAGSDPNQKGFREIAVSKTMRLDSFGRQLVGGWEASGARVVVRRDQLSSAESSFGTLMHEFGHGRRWAIGNSLDFEVELTSDLGAVANKRPRRGRRNRDSTARTGTCSSLTAVVTEGCRSAHAPIQLGERTLLAATASWLTCT